MGIERNDISGTLHRNELGTGEWETVFILFDSVPGGAGHVRRIGKGNEDDFRHLLQTVLRVATNCTCGEKNGGDTACYSCLCNYYNQKYHDILKRKYVIEFLRDEIGLD